MKFEIGFRVRYSSDLEKNYIVLATKEQNLTLGFLKSKKGVFHIEKIEKLAEMEIVVSNGFDYKIGEIIGYNDENAIIGKLTDVFENDIAE